MANSTSASTPGPTATFDPVRYKATTREQWQTAAEAWHRWTPAIQTWLGPATERMLDLAGVGPGSAVLDLAAGAGEPAITIAKRVGPAGSVLATDIAENILTYAEQAARQQGVANLATRVMDGEQPDLPAGSFDAVTSRVGLIYFPDQQGALSNIRRLLRPGGRVAAIVYGPADRNQFFSIPIGIIRRRAELPPAAPGQPGPFSLGGPGVLEEAYRRAGFRNIVTERLSAPLRLASASECVQFERQSFGALHQMMSGLAAEEQEDAWGEIERELSQFDGPDGFTGPCELVIGVGVK